MLKENISQLEVILPKRGPQMCFKRDMNRQVCPIFFLQIKELNELYEFGTKTEK